jgi:hypothetical protein
MRISTSPAFKIKGSNIKTLEMKRKAALVIRENKNPYALNYHGIGMLKN